MAAPLPPSRSTLLRRLRARARFAAADLRFFAVGVILTLTGCGDGPAEFQTVRIGDRTFQMELALTTRQRMRGLSNRDSIAADTGMLFVLPKPETVSFVMRRCKIPLDIIFLAPDGRIVAMHEMTVQPFDTPDRELKGYSSGEPAQFALEFGAGTLKQLGLSVGEMIELPVEELKSKAR
jgi:uncharacterized membrane protein (UPF0127 family)